MPVDVTELVWMEVDELHLVSSGANGFPQIMRKAAAGAVADVLKADDGKVDCPTCKGDGKIMGGNRKCPDCSASGRVTPETADKLKKSIDDFQALYDEVVKSLEAAKSCACISCVSLSKAEMSSKDINDLPDSAFAYVEPGGSKDADGLTTPRSLRHFPIQDKAHAKNALARLSTSPFGDKAKAKVVAAAKKFGIEVTEKADGTLDLSTGIPGSPAWEAQDAEALRNIATQLVEIKDQILMSANREAIEGNTVDPSDTQQSWMLQDAACMLMSVLGLVAGMAFTEQAEAMKSGRTLSGKNESKLRDAVSALEVVLSSLPQLDTEPIEKEIQMDLTKEELVEAVGTVVDDKLTKAFKERDELTEWAAAVKAKEEADAKKAGEDAEVEKQRVQDAAAATLASSGFALADDTLKIEKGEKPDDEMTITHTPTGLSEKGTDEAAVRSTLTAKVLKEGLAKSVGTSTAAAPAAPVADEATTKRLDELATGLGTLTQLVEKMAGEPLKKMTQGPQAGSVIGRGDTAPTDITARIAQMEKSLAESTDPYEREDLSTKITHAKLLAMRGADDATIAERARI